MDISTIHSLGQLYDNLFEELKRKFYDGKTIYSLPYLYENCKEIAEYIAKKMFDVQKDMLSNEEYHEVFSSLSEESKDSFSVMVENEHFYLLSFYYKTNKEKCSIEFIHKSLMEYLVSEILYYRLSQILELNEEKQKEELQKELDGFFTFNAITDEICLFFLEKVKKNEKQQLLFSLLKKYYKFYLEVEFMYKTNNNINSFTKIQNLFISYWKLLRILANAKKDNLLEDEKELFCSYLIRIPFENINLSYQNLAGTKLNGAKLNGADLTEADLTGTKLNQAELNQAELINAKLNRTKLNRADLNRAKLNGADLRKADLRKADLSEANLNGADLRKAKLNGARLSGAKLIKAELIKAELIKTKLNRTDLRWADLTGANLSEADLRKAKLNGARLSGAKLIKAELIKTKLNRVDLSEADLTEANLSKKDLKRLNYQKP